MPMITAAIEVISTLCDTLQQKWDGRVHVQWFVGVALPLPLRTLHASHLGGHGAMHI